MKRSDRSGVGGISGFSGQEESAPSGRGKRYQIRYQAQYQARSPVSLVLTSSAREPVNHPCPLHDAADRPSVEQLSSSLQTPHPRGSYPFASVWHWACSIHPAPGGWPSYIRPLSKVFSFLLLASAILFLGLILWANPRREANPFAYYIMSTLEGKPTDNCAAMPERVWRQMEVCGGGRVNHWGFPPDLPDNTPQGEQ